MADSVQARAGGFLMAQASVVMLSTLAAAVMVVKRMMNTLNLVCCAAVRRGELNASAPRPHLN
jgi:hypothetical protein